MITRYALFHEEVSPDKLEAFNKAVMDGLLPTWLSYPHATAVRVSFTSDRDDHAPNMRLVLAVGFASRDGLDAALNSQGRLDSRAATQCVLLDLVKGEIFHYMTLSSEHLVARATRT